MSAIDRNRPCPCGSGRKRKQCCGAPKGALAAARELHAIDERLFARILGLREPDFDAAIRKAIESSPFDPTDESNASIAGSYLLHMTRVADGTVAETFLRREGSRLTQEERDWLEACSQSWQSLWEVVDVFPERGLEMRDLLTGEERGVTERSATRSLRPRLVVCARVVKAKGVVVLAGCHPRPLDPLAADSAISEIRRILRAPRGPVPAARLRGEFGATLLRIWQDSVDRHDRRPLPRLQNTDGDPLQDTLDRFAIEPGTRQDVEARWER